MLFLLLVYQKNMTITEVKSRADKNAFLDAARVIYKNNKVWICPLDNDIEAVFDPKKNGN